MDIRFDPWPAKDEAECLIEHIHLRNAYVSWV